MSEVDSERGDGGKSTGDRDREKEKEKGARVEGQVLLHMLPQTDKLRELNDRKHMLYMLLTCMKTLLFGVTNYDRQPPHRGEARGETGGARTGQGEGEVNSGQAGAPQAKASADTCHTRRCVPGWARGGLACMALQAVFTCPLPLPPRSPRCPRVSPPRRCGW